MSVNLTNRVAIVTGAGAGLGREHALLLARLGAKVVVNDLGSDVNGRGGSSAASQKVVDEIVAAGGEAIANGASVTDAGQVRQLVEQTMARWGRIDILVNNAGFLRDKTFAKMTLEDFHAVLDVHLMGAVNCTKAVWDIMREQNYGRIVLTTSSSGLYGNFGQSNYGAAKMALVGLMQTLAIEGARNDIRVNCLAPTAGTRMLEGLMPQPMLDALTPGAVSPAVAVLASEQAPTRMILCAGAGSFEAAHITLTQGVHLGTGAHVPDALLDNLGAVLRRDGETVPPAGSAQGALELGKAGFDTQAGQARQSDTRTAAEVARPAARAPLSLAQLQALAGQELGVSGWMRVTQPMINDFADVTRDWQDIHIDENAARVGPFGRTVSHGFLTLSMLSAMAAEVLPQLEGQRAAINFGFNRLRFVAPVRSEEQIRGRFTLKDVTERSPGAYQLTLDVSVEIENQAKPALQAEWLTLINL